MGWRTIVGVTAVVFLTVLIVEATKEPWESALGAAAGAALGMWWWTKTHKKGGGNGGGDS